MRNAAVGQLFISTCLYFFDFNLIYPSFSTSKKYTHYKTFRLKKSLQSRWLHSCLYNNLPTIPVQAHSWVPSCCLVCLDEWCLESSQCSLSIYWNFILDNCFVELFVTVAESLQTSSFYFLLIVHAAAQHCWCVIWWLWYPKHSHSHIPSLLLIHTHTHTLVTWVTSVYYLNILPAYRELQKSCEWVNHCFYMSKLFKLLSLVKWLNYLCFNIYKVLTIECLTYLSNPVVNETNHPPQHRHASEKDLFLL